jgi:hypothetical protein
MPPARARGARAWWWSAYAQARKPTCLPAPLPRPAASSRGVGGAGWLPEDLSPRRPSRSPSPGVVREVARAMMAAKRARARARVHTARSALFGMVKEDLVE